MLILKIRQLLMMKGLNLKNIAEARNLSEAAIYKKSSNNALSIKDVIAVAELTNHKLCLIDNVDPTKIIEINAEDLNN